MAGSSPYVIKLSQQKRRVLESVAAKYASPYRDVVRAKIVLYAARGWSNEDRRAPGSAAPDGQQVAQALL